MGQSLIKRALPLLIAGVLDQATVAIAVSDNAPTTAAKDPAAMAMDLVLARPGGLVATVAGTAIFVVSLPFSALGGNTGEAFDSLVATPATYTFRRPLGDFDPRPAKTAEHPAQAASREALP